MSRPVLVTGASRGIDRAITCQLVANGLNIGVHYHRDAVGTQEALNVTVINKDDRCLLSFDAASHEQRWEVLEHEIAQHGAWYGVVSNAGIVRDAVFPALSNDGWGVVIHTNLNSFYNVTQPYTILMVGACQSGHVITLSSVPGAMGDRDQASCSATEARIVDVTKTLAIEFAKCKIIVNYIAPGLIGTGITEMEESALKEAMLMTLVKCMDQAEEVAGFANYLMSNIAGCVARRVISTNGGMS